MTSKLSSYRLVDFLIKLEEKNVMHKCLFCDISVEWLAKMFGFGFDAAGFCLNERMDSSDGDGFVKFRCYFVSLKTSSKTLSISIRGWALSIVNLNHISHKYFRFWHSVTTTHVDSFFHSLNWSVQGCMLITPIHSIDTCAKSILRMAMTMNGLDISLIQSYSQNIRHQNFTQFALYYTDMFDELTKFIVELCKINSQVTHWLLTVGFSGNNFQTLLANKRFGFYSR